MLYFMQQTCSSPINVQGIMRKLWERYGSAVISGLGDDDLQKFVQAQGGNVMIG